MMSPFCASRLLGRSLSHFFISSPTQLVIRSHISVHIIRLFSLLSLCSALLCCAVMFSGACNIRFLHFRLALFAPRIRNISTRRQRRSCHQIASGNAAKLTSMQRSSRSCNKRWHAARQRKLRRRRRQGYTYRYSYRWRWRWR